jgi:predicted transcriptional regulator
MPRAIFWLLWDTIKCNEAIGAYALNRAKDGRRYWVRAGHPGRGRLSVGLAQAVQRAVRRRAAGMPTNQVPAVSIRKSVTPDFVICLEDGKKLKMLKRYLRSRYKLSPEAYRAKWGLPLDYPMVAPNYSARRSEFAKKIGLGRIPAAVRRRKKV